MYLVLERQTGKVDGWYRKLDQAKTVCESYTVMWPENEYVVLKRVSEDMSFPAGPEIYWSNMDGKDLSSPDMVARFKRLDHWIKTGEITR